MSVRIRVEKQGFTLVELSIVLVIIGLLIGGVLVAQSMINTAKIQALTRQVGQYDAAINNFETKYRGLPGDVKAVSGLAGTAGLSDGNGFIASTGSANGVDSFSGEVGQFWRDLSLTGMLTEGQGSANTPPNTFAASGAGGAAGNLITGAIANVPKAKAGRSTAVVIVGGIAYGIVTTGNTAANAWVTTSVAAGNGALKPADALALDSKLDDGRPDFPGKIYSIQLNIPIDTNGLTTCATGGVYVTSTTTEDCTLSVRIGTSFGMSRD